MRNIDFCNENNLTVIPVQPRKKKTSIVAWQVRRLEDNSPGEFKEDSNFGVVLGSPSNNLVEIGLLRTGTTSCAAFHEDPRVRGPYRVGCIHPRRAYRLPNLYDDLRHRAWTHNALKLIPFGRENSQGKIIFLHRLRSHSLRSIIFNELLDQTDQHTSSGKVAPLANLIKLSLETNWNIEVD